MAINVSVVLSFFFLLFLFYKYYIYNNYLVDYEVYTSNTLNTISYLGSSYWWKIHQKNIIQIRETLIIQIRESSMPYVVSPYYIIRNNTDTPSSIMQKDEVPKNNAV
jgi:hypothetical protein